MLVEKIKQMFKKREETMAEKEIEEVKKEMNGESIIKNERKTNNVEELSENAVMHDDDSNGDMIDDQNK